ncbi:MAG: SHOCT domain-containing protein [Lacticaseibacillus paracasei]
MKKNKLIVRRLVAGVLLIVTALWAFYDTAVFGRLLAFYRGTNMEMVVQSEEGLVIMSGILGLIVGIVYISTSKRRPVKWLEYTITGVAIVFLLLSQTAVDLLAGGIVSVIRWLIFLFVGVGLPLKNGYKDMPFASKKASSITDVVSDHDLAETGSNKNDKTNMIDDTDLRKLKKLLDDGIISEQEFNAKKKQLLGL